MRAQLRRDPGSAEAMMERLVDQNGGVRRVADLLDRAPSVVYSWTSPRENVSPSFRHVDALTAPGTSSAAEYLAAKAGGVFLPLPQEGDSVMARNVSEMALESGEFFSRAFKALADGKLSKEEAREMRAELDDVLRFAAHIRGQLDAVGKCQPAGEVLKISTPKRRA